MPVMDEFREEREAIKQKSRKEQWDYFWGYYKWYVIGGAALLAVIIYIIYTRVTTKNEVLFGIALNSSLTEIGTDASEELLAGYVSSMGLDTSKNEAYLSTGLYMRADNAQASYQANQSIATYVAARSLDICIMDEASFAMYGYDCTFLDLETCLDKEFLDSVSDKLFYVDLPLAEEYRRRQDEDESTEDMVFPAGSDTDSMDDPHPVGIDVSGCTGLLRAYGYTEEDGPLYIGIVRNSKHTDAAVKFVQFLFSSSENNTLPQSH